ncbi:MAG TPA: hypothetical protein VHA13_04675, partial [Gammaproteobacteria bacterium]|nr:hypothetical protein [Gammaproteobacteria bacterium]
MRSVTILISILFLLTGCSNQPRSNDQMARNTAGATLGTAAAIAGTAALGAPRPLVIGAGIGGAALGYYLTTMRFDAGPIYRAGGEVYTQGEYAGVSIPAYRLFEPNSSDLLPQGEALLDSAIAV